MNCKDVMREISNYIDGDLEAAVRQQLEEHLRGCKECTLTLDQTKKTITLLCDAEPVPLPEDVRARLYVVLQNKIGTKPN